MAIRQKSNQELSFQLSRVNDFLGKGSEIGSMSDEDFSDIDFYNIKSAFPLRYSFYLEILRSLKNIQPDLSNERIEYIKKWLIILKNLSLFLKNKEKISILRPTQVEVFKSFLNFIESGGSRGYIKLPTGVGKTVIFTMLAEAIGIKTLVVVPAIILANQTAGTFENFTNLIPKEYHSGPSGVAEFDGDAKCNIITYQSLNNKIKKEPTFLSNFELVILDEAHNALSQQNLSNLGLLEGEEKKESPPYLTIGFTATPEYNPEKSLDKKLGREIYRLDIVGAVERGLIAPFSCLLALVDIDMSGIRIDSKTGDFTESDLERLINKQGLSEGVFKLYKEMFADNQAFVFCAGVKHAGDVAEIFKKGGVKAEVVSGKTDKKVLQRILSEFEAGEIKVLCNADLLATGVDSRGVSVCLNLRMTSSKVFAEQRGGRVLRLPRNPRETKLSFIVDLMPKNNNGSGKRVVTFPDVVGHKNLLRVSGGSVGKGGARGGKKGSENNDPPPLEGLTVVVDHEEVLRVLTEKAEEQDMEDLEFVRQQFGLVKKVFIEKEIFNYTQYNRKWRDRELNNTEPFSSQRRWPKNLPEYFNNLGLTIKENETDEHRPLVWGDFFSKSSEQLAKESHESLQNLFESICVFCKAYSIKTFGEYKSLKDAHQKTDFPANPTKYFVYHNFKIMGDDGVERSITYSDFLCQEKKPPSYEQFKKIIASWGVSFTDEKTYLDLRRERKMFNFLPLKPSKFYGEQFESFEVLTRQQNDKVDRYEEEKTRLRLGYFALRAFLRSRAIKNYSEYNKLKKQFDDKKNENLGIFLPARPDVYFNKFDIWPEGGWDEFLLGIRFYSFDKLSEECVREGVKTIAQYREKRQKKLKELEKKDTNENEEEVSYVWPAAPDKFYRDFGGRGGWEELFKIEKKELLSFEELKKELKKYPNITTPRLYISERKELNRKGLARGWPARPDMTLPNFDDKGGWGSLFSRK